MRPALVKVWDPLVRLFHWSLVLSFTIAWISAEEWDRLHEWSGYAVAALVAARLLWGLFGTRHARFSDFVHKPSTVMVYLKDVLVMKSRRYLGHNPAGGAMVVALLAALAGTAGTGVATTTDAYWGVEWVEELHELLANLTLMLVGLHVAGVIVASLQHRENLIRSMVTGLKRKED